MKTPRRTHRVALSLLLVLALAGAGYFVVRARVARDVAVAAPEAVADSTAAQAAPPADADRADGDHAKGDKKSGKKKGKDGKDGADEPAAAVPVELATAVSRDLPAYFHATGALEARRQVELIAKAAGQVTALHVEEGRSVRQGDVLLEIDHREEKIQLEKALVEFETAAAELRRVEGMLPQGLVTQREFDEKKQRADLAAYERDLTQTRLENKIVRAPFAGQITSRKIELGQTVGVGQALVSIADVNPLQVKLYLPEQVVKSLRLDQPVEVRPDVSSDEALAGTVELISPVVDPQTATVKVTLRVEDLRGAARVGSFVRARITTDVHQQALAIPKRGVVSEAGASYVFVAVADSVTKLAVETGYADDDFIELTSGAKLGDRIVVVGQGGLRQGSKIRVLEAPTAAAAVAAKPQPSATDVDAGGN